MRAGSRPPSSASYAKPVPFRRGSTIGTEHCRSDDNGESGEQQVRQQHFPGRHLSQRISVTLPVRTGEIAMTAMSRREIRMAAMRDFHDIDSAMAMQQAAADAADHSASGFASMYSVKPKGRRGRQLPAAQLPAARQLVQGKLNAKALRSGASSKDVVSGYAHSHTALGESGEDSDDDQRQPIASSAAASSSVRQPLPLLPRGAAHLWLRVPPAEGDGLVGWPIMALFSAYDGQPYSEQRWHDGTVVAYDESNDKPHIAFFESDNIWESMQFPDDTVVFMKGTAAAVRVTVHDDMLPGNDEDLD